MGMELSSKTWKVAFGDGQKHREVDVEAGDMGGLLRAIEKSKDRLGLPKDCPVSSCYEAGRDGFWLDRFLVAHGVENVLVDAASIEVSRQARRAKTDRLDAQQLLGKLVEHGAGKKVWKVVRVPSEEAEDERRGHRERGRLLKERTGHRNRIRSLLVLQGIRRMPRVEDYEKDLGRMRRWDGQELPGRVQEELLRECRRLAVVEEQLRELKQKRRREERQPQSVAQSQAVKLKQLKAVGTVSAEILTTEFFGWRQFQNRRQVGSLAGLTGTPYDSGGSRREQGISKAGNPRVRATMIELAWSWLRWQRGSALTKWFWERFGHGSPRMRRVGIVALARKLLVALWKYLERDEIPAGAVLRAAS
jgi:transposase